MTLALPPDRDFSSEGIPAEARQWMEAVVLRQLNEFGRPLRTLLRERVGAELLNVQVLEKRVEVPDDWTPLALGSGWSAVTAREVVAIRKTDAGEVAFRGSAKHTGAAPQTLVASLSAAYRPAGTRSFLVNGNGAAVAVDAYADGRLIASAGTLTTSVHLDGLRWVASDRSPVAASCWGANCEFRSALRTAAALVLPGGAFELDASNKPNGHVCAGMAAPSWEESDVSTAVSGKQARRIRILNQAGLSPGKSYLCRWLAVGST